MLISLVKPLNYYYKLPRLNIKNTKYLNFNYLKLESHNDNRFKIFKHLKKLKKFDHKKELNL